MHLGPVVFAPDVEHEHAGNKQQGHHQNGHRTNLYRVVEVRQTVLLVGPPVHSGTRGTVFLAQGKPVQSK